MKPQFVVDAWKTCDVPIELVVVPPVNIEDIYLAHEVPYVDGVLAGQIENGFENFSLEIANTLLYTNGSMRDAAKRAIENGVMAVSPTSGFHHAFHYAASGFCTFNGLMITAQWLLRNGYAKRIGIVDCDFHYGNGTDQIINKLDLHRQVKHFTAGNEFYRVDHAPVFFEKLYQQLQFMKDCDVILYQAGADPHINDPLGGFLTTEQLYERDRLVFTECKRRNVPVAWNFAGGYQQHADGSTNWEALIEIHSNTLKAAWEVVQ
jgi:acetoin utilization deacetylase AcuC-like enzyme